MFKIFEIKGGKFKVLPDLEGKKIKGLIVSSIILFLIASVSGWLKIDENSLIKIYTAIADHFDLEYIIQENPTEKVLDSKIELEVDRSIDNYKKEYGEDIDYEYLPRYIEEEAKPENKTGDAGLLGGPMRICSPWIDGCEPN